MWGDRRREVKQTRGDLFDTKALRERPMLRTANGYAIILDLSFYAEQAAVGPLFTLTSWLPRSRQEKGGEPRVHGVRRCVRGLCERESSEGCIRPANWLARLPGLATRVAGGKERSTLRDRRTPASMTSGRP